jgi:erythromycin esterase-like protein
MAGFDMQVTVEPSLAKYGADLRAFAGAVRDPAVRERATALALTATTARRELFVSGFTDRLALASLLTSAQEFRTLVQARNEDFVRAWGADHVDFIDRTVANMRADAQQRADGRESPASTPEREKRRDALNAENLRWLLEGRYARRKVLIWAHNVHVMNAYYSPDFRDIHLAAGPGDMKPTGVFLSERFGDELYTIGMTAFEGSEGLATGGPQTAVPPAPSGGLEAKLHAQGHAYAFVKLRAAGSSMPAQSIRMPKFLSNEVSDPGQVYDGVFFVDRTGPATPLQG